MSLTVNKLNRRPASSGLHACCLLATLMASGCSSSSSNSASGVDELSTDEVMTSIDGNTENSASDEMLTDSNDGAGTPDDANSDNTSNIPNSSIEDENAEIENTRVTFDITVPVYVSDSLRVRLVWGELDTTADWVEDESWSVSELLPENIENNLTITFADANGSITLATFETAFQTGTNATETVQIIAEQFNTARWDSDDDGISNLDESIAGTNPLGESNLVPALANLELVAGKTFRISWQTTHEPEFYRILENADGLSGFSQVGEDLDPSSRAFDHRVALYNRVNAQYIVQSCNDSACLDSNELFVTGTLEPAIGSVQPANKSLFTQFGNAVTLNADGRTMAISGTIGSDLITVDNEGIRDRSGAIYVLVQTETEWQVEAVLTPSQQDEHGFFGLHPSLSADGSTLAVYASGISNFDRETWTSQVEESDMVYIFVRTSNGWQEQAHFKTSNEYNYVPFSETSLSLSADGNTLSLGSPYEANSGAGINGQQDDTSAERTGAVYVFARANGVWQQQAYIKASDSEEQAHFGSDVDLSGDGNTLVVSARIGSSVYVFTRNDETWQQQTQLERDLFLGFGTSVSVSHDGNTLAVGASNDGSGATGIDADENDNSSLASGATYVFVQNNGTWQQQSFIKASVTGGSDFFGSTVDLSADGNTLLVGAQWEASTATGINGNANDNADPQRGAAYVFLRSDSTWRQQAFLKPPNGDYRGSSFSTRMSLSSDGNTVAIGGASQEVYIY